MNINDFPPEILEKILCLVDAKTLVCAQRVCHYWRNTIRNVFNSQVFWYRNCILEMDQKMMMDFQMTASFRSTEKGLLWEKLYKKWMYLHVLERFKKYTSITENTFNNDCYVTAIKVTGNCVITAISLISQVLIWHILSKELSFALTHNADVLTLELMDFLHSGPYEGSGGYYTDHHLLITGGEDHTIRLFSLLSSNKVGTADIKDYTSLHQHGSPIRFLRSYGSQLLAQATDGTISIWKISIANQTVEAKLQTFILGGESLCYSLGFCDNMITGIWGHDCSLQAISLPNVEWHLPQRIDVIMKDSKEAGFEDPDVLKVKSCHVFHDSLIVLLTADKQLCISPGGLIYHKYNTMLSLHAHVTAVVVFGNIIILGTNLGSVYFYRFNKVQELLNLDLTAPVCYFHLGDDPVSLINVNVTDVRPVVAVALGARWYVIQWKYSICLSNHNAMIPCV